jgi:hypothetical protein
MSIIYDLHCEIHGLAVQFLAKFCKLNIRNMGHTLVSVSYAALQHSNCICTVQWPVVFGKLQNYWKDRHIIKKCWSYTWSSLAYADIASSTTGRSQDSCPFKFTRPNIIKMTSKLNYIKLTQSNVICPTRKGCSGKICISKHHLSKQSWGFHNGENLFYYLLGYDNMQSAKWVLMFQSNRLSSPTGRYLYPEDGSRLFLWNTDINLPDYMVS